MYSGWVASVTFIQDFWSHNLALDIPTDESIRKLEGDDSIDDDDDDDSIDNCDGDDDREELITNEEEEWLTGEGSKKDNRGTILDHQADLQFR